MIEDGELREMALGWRQFQQAAAVTAASARSATVVWRYVDAAAPWGFLEPHVAERSGLDRCDEHLVPEGVGADDVDRLGYDSEGRLVIREPCGRDGWTEAATYSGDTSESFRFMSAADPQLGVNVLTVSRQRWSGGVIVSHRRFWPPPPGARRIVSWLSEEYGRDSEGHVVAVSITRFTASFDRRPVTFEQRLLRGSDGAIERVEEVSDDGTTVTVFNAPSEDRAAAPSRYQEALRRDLVVAARAIWPPDPVLGIVVVTSDGGSLPPDLVLVTHSRLQQLLDDDPNDPHGAWMVGEHQLWATDAIREQPTEGASWRAVATEFGGDPARVWALLRAICVDMLEEDWSDLPGGSSAIVCLADATNEGRAEFFSGEESRLAEYRQRGWVPYPL